MGGARRSANFLLGKVAIDGALSTSIPVSVSGSSGSGTAVYASLSTGFTIKNLTVSTAALQLTATSTPVRTVSIVKADPTNTGTVYLITGSGGTAATGFPLNAGEVIVVDIDNLTKLWFIASAASQKVAVEAST